MKIQTVNQLISVFKDISTRHYQINGFGIGDDWENGASEAKMHPVLWINPTTANMPATENGYKTFEIDFEVRVFDLVNKDESNENEVLSDCIDILKDIITEFKGHPYYVNSQLNIIDDIGFEAFTEEFDEEVSGWVCEISLMTPILNSFCGIPAADITGFEFPGTDCPDVNVLCPVFVEDVTGVSPIVVTTIGTTKQISLDGDVGSDVFVVSGSYNTGTSNLELLRNDGVTVLADLSSINTTDTHLTSAVYDNSTTTLDLTLTDGTVFNVDLSALKDDTNTHLTGLVFNANNDNTLVATLNNGTLINSLIDNFDDLTVNGDVNATNFIGDGSQLTNLPGGGGGGASGVLGISNSLGEYTYYNTYTLALAAASDGDTIEQFADITETSAIQISIDKNINISMNGHTYTLDSATNTTAFKLTGGSLTDVKILNGSINKINGTGGATFSSISTSGLNPLLNLNGTTLSNDLVGSNTLDVLSDYIIKGVTVTGNGNISISTDCILTDFNYVGGGSVVLYSTAKSYNGYVSSTTTGSALFLTSVSSEASNISAYNTAGFAIRNAGTINSCKGYSEGNLGIYTYVNGNMFNCFGFSNGSYGIQFHGNECVNTVAKSTASYGFYVGLNQNCKLSNCSAFSSVASAFYLATNGNNSEVYGCHGESTLNASTGHAFFMQNGTVKLVDCSGKVLNSGANCIRSNTSANAYIVNLVGEGMTTLISNIIQLQTNTADSFGNTLIG